MNSLSLRYLNELLKRIIFSVLFYGAVFLIISYFANPLFSYLAAPLLKTFPPGSELIVIHVTSVLTVPLRFSFYLATMLSRPFFLYQLWIFIAPALYKKEKNNLVTLFTRCIFILFRNDVCLLCCISHYVSLF